MLALQTRNARQQFLYYGLAILHFLATSYTGTRTATLMVVAAIVFYCILTLYQRRTLIFSGVFAFMITALLVAPIYDNMVINRLRSTFEGSKDPSEAGAALCVEPSHRWRGEYSGHGGADVQSRALFVLYSTG